MINISTSLGTSAISYNLLKFQLNLSRKRSAKTVPINSTCNESKKGEGDGSKYKHPLCQNPAVV